MMDRSWIIKAGGKEIHFQGGKLIKLFEESNSPFYSVLKLLPETHTFNIGEDKQNKLSELDQISDTDTYYKKIKDLLLCDKDFCKEEGKKVYSVLQEKSFSQKELALLHGTMTEVIKAYIKNVIKTNSDKPGYKWEKIALGTQPLVDHYTFQQWQEKQCLKIDNNNFKVIAKDGYIFSVDANEGNTHFLNSYPSLLNNYRNDDKPLNTIISYLRTGGPDMMKFTNEGCPATPHNNDIEKKTTAIGKELTAGLTIAEVHRNPLTQLVNYAVIDLLKKGFASRFKMDSSAWTLKQIALARRENGSTDPDLTNTTPKEISDNWKDHIKDILNKYLTGCKSYTNFKAFILPDDKDKTECHPMAQGDVVWQINKQDVLKGGIEAEIVEIYKNNNINYAPSVYLQETKIIADWLDMVSLARCTHIGSLTNKDKMKTDYKCNQHSDDQIKGFTTLNLRDSLQKYVKFSVLNRYEQDWQASIKKVEQYTKNKKELEENMERDLSITDESFINYILLDSSINLDSLKNYVKTLPPGSAKLKDKLKKIDAKDLREAVKSYYDAKIQDAEKNIKHFEVLFNKISADYNINLETLTTDGVKYACSVGANYQSNYDFVDLYCGLLATNILDYSNSGFLFLFKSHHHHNVKLHHHHKFLEEHKHTDVLMPHLEGNWGETV